MPLIAAGTVTLQDAVGKQKTKKYGEGQKKSLKEITHSFKQEVPYKAPLD